MSARTVFTAVLVASLLLISSPAAGQISDGPSSEAPTDSLATAVLDSMATVIPDSTLRDLEALGEAAPDSALAAQAQEDGVSGQGSSANAAQQAPPRSFFGALRPRAEASVRSDVTKIQTKGVFSGSPQAVVGTTGDVTYTATNTTYRQQDREQELRSLNASLREDLGVFGKLVFDLDRRTTFDENRVANSTITLQQESSDARIKLGKAYELGDGFSHTWAARGDFEDAKEDNRGVDNDRNLAGTSITTAWRHERDNLDLKWRYGYSRNNGNRTVRGIKNDASAERDTLAAEAVIDGIPRLSLTVKARRVTFVEERLDFARNTSGVVDTVNTDTPVAQERESVQDRDMSLSATSQLLPRLRLSGDVSSQYGESQYRFSRQGFIQRGTDRAGADATLRYAEAGSLRVAYSFQDRYNDRRTRDDDGFRGRESNRAYSAEAKLMQGLLARSDFEMTVRQTLDQSIFREQGNDNDRDKLFEVIDAEVSSDAIPRVKIDVGATASRSEDLNIAAARVGNNKEERLFEVRSSYSVDPGGGLRFGQTYRLQIRYIDQFNSDDNDQFNKQGQLNTTLDYDLATGGSLSLDYVVDYRRTGTRDTSVPYREVYRRDVRRFDHRVTARMRVPLGLFDLNLNSERGFLREERNTTEVNDDRGSFSAKLSGDRGFARNRVKLSLDVERVLQFGPRVRDEQKDFWRANTTLTVSF